MNAAQKDDARLRDSRWIMRHSHIIRCDTSSDIFLQSLTVPLLYLVKSDEMCAAASPHHAVWVACLGVDLIHSFAVVPCSLCRQPLTALRLDMWLRSFLCSAENSRFDAGFDIEKSFPDVFRTARTLARAIAQRASALVTNGNNQGEQGPGSNGYQTPYPGSRGYDVAELLRPDFVNGNSNGDGGGNSRQGVGAAERLEPPRQALAGRLQSTPATGELISWVTSVVKTAKQYRQWLPWQPFADELRELVLLSVRQRSVQEAAACGGDGEGAGGRALTAKAAVFAVCELLCAWEETPEVGIDGFTAWRSVDFIFIIFPQYFNWHVLQVGPLKGEWTQRG